MVAEKKIRVLIAKPGLDGHDRGAKILALAMRDAGFEVIYTGVRLSAWQLVDAIIQEDPDVVMLSSLSGAHNVLFEQIMKVVRKNELDDKLFVAGGIIPQSDYRQLKKMGIREIFGIHDDLDTVIEFIEREFEGY